MTQRWSICDAVTLFSPPVVPYDTVHHSSFFLVRYSCLLFLLPCFVLLSLARVPVGKELGGGGPTCLCAHVAKNPKKMGIKRKENVMKREVLPKGDI